MERKTFEIGHIRPPFHADSLLLRVTENCTWNRCNFCTLYKGGKFKMRSVEDVKKDIDNVKYYQNLIFRRFDGKGFDMARIMADYSALPTDEEKNCYSMVFNWIQSDGMKTVFLQDANTLALKKEMLCEILRHLRKTLPTLKTVACYGRADSLIRLSTEDFKELKAAGLTMIHSGYESGCDDVLKILNKGTTREQQIESGKRIKTAGLEFNVFYMPGSGGKTLSQKNAIETADVINQIDPEFIRIRTFVVKPSTVMWQKTQTGEFEECSDIEKLLELKTMIEHLDGIKSYLISDHIINLLPLLQGNIDKDKESMLSYINGFLSLPKREQMRFQLARRMCYNVDYTNMSYLNSADMKAIDSVIDNCQSKEEWEEILRRYLRRYI